MYLHIPIVTDRLAASLASYCINPTCILLWAYNIAKLGLTTLHSCQLLNSKEWSFQPEVFWSLWCRWGAPDMDVLSLGFNNNLSRFISRNRDALLTLWDRFNLIYSFSSLCLICRIEMEGIKWSTMHQSFPGGHGSWTMSNFWQTLSVGPPRSSWSSGLEPAYHLGNGVAVKAEVLSDPCLSVILMLLKARKLTDLNIYFCFWKAYFTRFKARMFYPRNVFLHQIPFFFSSFGLDQLWPWITSTLKSKL